MLWVHDSGASNWSRRGFLTAGSLGLAGLTLPDLLRVRAETRGDTDFIRDKSVLFVFLSGGPTQYETFTPNMDAPEPYRSTIGEIKTSLPGVTFSSVFPQLAQRAHKMAVIRSFVPSKTIGEHAEAAANVLTGGTRQRTDTRTGHSIGAAYARLRGNTNPETGLPSHIALSCGSHGSMHYKFFLEAHQGGSLGPGHAPFQLEPILRPAQDNNTPTAKLPENRLLQEMTLSLPSERLDDRVALRQSLDLLQRKIDQRDAEAHDHYTKQAVQVLRGVAARGFDLAQEPAAIQARYDTSDMKARIKTDGSDTNAYRYDPMIENYGRYLLLARRLIEAGAGFVTVQMAGWDMHADGNNPNVGNGMKMIGPALDRALAALMDDLEMRGLSDRVLVVVTGEFGRTGKMQGEGGRNHWAQLSPLLLIGGGLKMGQVIGQYDRQNSTATGDAISLPQLIATMMHTLFDLGKLRITRGVPAELLQFVGGVEPIARLL